MACKAISLDAWQLESFTPYKAMTFVRLLDYGFLLDVQHSHLDFWIDHSVLQVAAELLLILVDDVDQVVQSSHVVFPIWQRPSLFRKAMLCQPGLDMFLTHLCELSLSILLLLGFLFLLLST